MGLRQDVLDEIERTWERVEQAQRDRADAERWRELDRELEERGFGRMAPADVVRLLVPREVIETLRDWLLAREREALLRMPLHKAVTVAAWMAGAENGGNGHSEEFRSFSEPIPWMPVTGVTTAYRKSIDAEASNMRAGVLGPSEGLG